MAFELIMLGVGVLLTIGTGFFVASEFSLVNLDRSDLGEWMGRGYDADEIRGQRHRCRQDG